MSGALFWRAALIQTGAVVLASLALAAVLPHDFFEDWGWLAGPIAWVACAALTARALSLPTGPVLLGAVLAGVPSAVAVLLGAHWLGVVIAVAVFSVWCARIGRREVAWT